MKIVRVVGKVRWLYLIDVLHHKYKDLEFVIRDTAL